MVPSDQEWKHASHLFWMPSRSLLWITTLCLISTDTDQGFLYPGLVQRQRCKLTLHRDAASVSVDGTGSWYVPLSLNYYGRQ